MDRVQKAIQHLKDISWKIGTTGVEYLSDKDGQKMRESIELIENKTDEILNTERLIEWINTEIRITESRISEYGECFDGVYVDNETRIELCKRHIRFCENALKQLQN